MDTDNKDLSVHTDPTLATPAILRCLNDEMVTKDLQIFIPQIIEYLGKITLLMVYCMGHGINKVKESLPHGKFTEWKKTYRLSNSTLDNYRAVATTFQKFFPDKSPLEIYYLLAEFDVTVGSTIVYDMCKAKEPIREELIKKFVKNKTITRAEIDEIQNRTNANLGANKSKPKGHTSEQSAVQTEHQTETQTPVQAYPAASLSQVQPADIKRPQLIAEPQIQPEQNGSENHQTDEKIQTAVQQPKQSEVPKLHVQSKVESTPDFQDETKFDPLDALEDQKDCLKQVFKSVKLIVKKSLDNSEVSGLENEIQKFIDQAMELAVGLEEFKREKLSCDSFSHAED